MEGITSDSNRRRARRGEAAAGTNIGSIIWLGGVFITLFIPPEGQIPRSSAAGMLICERVGFPSGRGGFALAAIKSAVAGKEVKPDEIK